MKHHYKLITSKPLDLDNLPEALSSILVSLKEEIAPKTDITKDQVKSLYVALFKEASPDKPHSTAQAYTRILKLLKENPSITFSQIIKASQLYLSATSPTYVMYAHYFIEKGVGSAKVMPVLDWIEKLEDNPSPTRVSTSVTLQ